MVKEDLFKTGDKERIWKKYAGFLYLSPKEFMEIQEDLLRDQIELIADTPLGRKLMNNGKPATIAEFRQIVPLTTYEAYAPYLEQRNNDELAEKPVFWVHTSGRSGRFKWIPYTEKALRTTVDNIVSAFFLACASRKDDVNMTGKEFLLYNAPPVPYFAGMVSQSLSQLYDLRAVIPVDLAEKMSFQTRVAEGFRLSLRTGIDLLGSLTTILVKTGEDFEKGLKGTRISPFMLHPLVLMRLIRGLIRSKVEGRGLLPRDIWQPKAIVCGGTDTDIYRKEIIHYWGKEPYELYASTEAGFIALQSWNRKGMTFLPFSDFYEFIPETEWLKSKQDKTYQPSTVLLSEVEAGKRYELVITNFYGMPLLRYRTGDLIKFISLNDEETGVNLPQMVFESRADDLIDIAGFTRLDEKTIWQAIASCNVKYADWTIRKEYQNNKPALHLYIELKEEIKLEELRDAVHEGLKTVSSDYNDLEKMLGFQPLQVTFLSKDTFLRFYQEQQAKGADLAHLKPAHMNIPDSTLEVLLRLSNQN